MPNVPCAFANALPHTSPGPLPSRLQLDPAKAVDIGPCGGIHDFKWQSRTSPSGLSITASVFVSCTAGELSSRMRTVTRLVRPASSMVGRQWNKPVPGSTVAEGGGADRSRWGRNGGEALGFHRQKSSWTDPVGGEVSRARVSQDHLRCGIHVPGESGASACPWTFLKTRLILRARREN